MRDAQKEYFRSRCKTVLEKSKRLEKQVDRSVSEIMGGQKSLFGAEKKGGA